MRATLFISMLGLLLFGGCTLLKPPASEWSLEPTRASEVLALEPPRDGKILVFVGGNSTQHGKLWIAEHASLATVEELAAVRPEWASRSVQIRRIGQDGTRTRRIRIDKMTRADKEKVAVQHGDTIYFLWDRCFGAAPNNGFAADKRRLLAETGVTREAKP